jgi:hypothetical protein
MVVFENRSGVDIWVHEHRKRRKLPFAGRHGVNPHTLEQFQEKYVTVFRPELSKDKYWSATQP